MKFDHVTAVVPDADVAADALHRLLGEAPVASLALPGMAIRSFRLGGDLHQPQGANGHRLSASAVR